MKKAMTIALAAILMIGALAAYAPAQEKADPPQLKTEMIRLNYSVPQEVRELVHPYQSPFGRITWAPGNEKLLVISDTPENVARLIKIIREIDVKPADILFTVQLVLGSESGAVPTDEALKDDKIVAELKSLLRYKSFTLLDQNFVRTMDQRPAEILMGKDPEFAIQFNRPKVVKDGAIELIQTDIRLVRIDVGHGRTTSAGTPVPSASTTLVQTSLSMKSGEKTVVGVSRMNGGDKGLILIILGKIVG
jgi:hypothetical protein